MSGITDLGSLHSSTVHTAMHCRAFRDDDILKFSEQFCSLYISRIYTIGACLLSERGVIATTTMFFLHVSPLCEYCLGLRWLRPNQSAGCNFPYETRGMLDICDGILDVFPWPAMLPVCHHWPAPLWRGDLALSPSRLRGYD